MAPRRLRGRGMDHRLPAQCCHPAWKWCICVVLDASLNLRMMLMASNAQSSPAPSMQKLTLRGGDKRRRTVSAVPYGRLENVLCRAHGRRTGA
eukprot:844835-Alexandrium_andersonii.AAC.1